MLKAYGDDIDVDAFLVGCCLPVCAVTRRGHPVFPASQPYGRCNERSGVHVSVSDADFDNFPQQVTDAIAFLTVESEQIRRLREFPGVEVITLDFGIERRGVIVQCEYLSPDVLTAGCRVCLVEQPCCNRLFAGSIWLMYQVAILYANG